VAGNRGLHADDEEDRISLLEPILPPNRRPTCRDNGQFVTDELRYMIPRNVELRLGVENAGEENLLVRQFSKSFESTIGPPGGP
jgi:hypothetical protein